MYENVRATGEPVPTQDDDPEYRRLNDQLNAAAAASPWWARILYR